MRHLTYGVLLGLLLATPAVAQPASSPAPGATQSQAVKDGKAAEQTAKPASQTAPAAGDPATPAAAPQEVKEDPMANFNILGNAVGDGLGVPR